MKRRFFIILLSLLILAGCSSGTEAEKMLESKYGVDFTLRAIEDDKYYFISNDDYAVPVEVTYNDDEFTDNYVNGLVGSELRNVFVSSLLDKSVSCSAEASVYGHFITTYNITEDLAGACRECGTSAGIDVIAPLDSYTEESAQVFIDTIDAMADEYGVSIIAEVSFFENYGDVLNDFKKFGINGIDRYQRSYSWRITDHNGTSAADLISSE